MGDTWDPDINVMDSEIKRLRARIAELEANYEQALESYALGVDDAKAAALDRAARQFVGITTCSGEFARQLILGLKEPSD